MDRDDTKLVRNNLPRAPRPQVILKDRHLSLQQEPYEILDDFVRKDVQGVDADCCNMHLEQEFLVDKVFDNFVFLKISRE